MRSARSFILIIAMCGLTACTTTRYTWENYDRSLYSHYKNPAENEQFVGNLKEIVLAGEQSGKVPPGVYAEYGYVLYEKGQFPEAILYFQKEHDKWPESRALMVKMINNAKARDKNKRTPDVPKKETDDIPK